ncbi:MAG TPA: hypothetical protein VFS23_40055 [Vicinamibacterales bacterium]|nr:hypothetical protein [Vicinamibacterales bacterium]
MFHALVSIVAYPLCALLGGLWNLRTDDGHELRSDTGTILDES